MQYTTIVENDVNIFFKPARLIVAGYSGSGKSTLVVNIIRKYRENFNRVIVLGNDLEQSRELEIERDDTFNPFDENLKGNTLLIFDDIIYNKQLLTLAGEVFIRSRHYNVSVILVTQNLFLSDKNFRQITLNTTHIIILRNRDERQIITFARSFLPNEKLKKFLDLYKKIVTKKRHQYLMVDFTADCDSPLLIRTSIIGEGYERAFLLE